MTAIDHKYAALGAPAGFHRHITAFAINIAWRYLLALLVLVVLGIVPAGLAWAQDGDGRTCPPGTHCRHPNPGKPCIGPCDPDAPPSRIIVVDWQNSGFQNGTALYPFRTLPQALAAAAPGYTIAIRTGFYSFQEARLVFDKAATIRAENGLVTIGSSAIWVDAQTGKPAPHPAPYDLVTRGFDDNGIPLNPMLGSQTWSPPQLPDPSLCGGNDRWKPPCTNQIIWIDNNWVNCPRPLGAPLGGHANWMLITNEGSVYWKDHSYYLQDDDYSLTFCSDELFCSDWLHGLNLHSEFNSDQTINYFHTWYWDALHQAVDLDGGKGGIRHGPWTWTRPLVDGKDAIMMGLFGLDCGHPNCANELHPVYAMALHVNNNLDDDVWAIFVRNWGDEGYCSSGQEEISPGQPFTFTFRFRRPGASAVSLIAAAAWDSAGQLGTVFHSDHGAPGAGWSEPTLISGEGATMTFTLPPPKERERINGMLHLKWSVSGPSASRSARPVERPSDFKPEVSSESDEPERAIRELITQMTPTQKQTFFALLGGEGPPQPAPHRPVPLPVQAAPPPGTRQGPPPQVQQVPDTQRGQKDRQLFEAFRAVYGDRLPLPPSPH
jgi:hypothetical protein